MSASSRTAVYTHGHHESVLRSHRWRTGANSAAYLLPELRPGLDLLDVGCGPGTITADLAALVAPGRVVAVDTSEDVLESARAVSDERGHDNVTFATADVHALPYDDGAFDVVHAHQVLQHVGDPVQALREMRRVCRPGGVVAARDSDYAGMTWYPQLAELDAWLDLYQRIARSNGGEPDAGRRLLAWAHEAGFDEVAASSGTWCFATPTDRAWWAGMWADRTLGSAFADFATERGFATHADLERISEAWREWSADPDAWFSVVHGEIVCRN